MSTRASRRSVIPQVRCNAPTSYGEPCRQRTPHASGRCPAHRHTEGGVASTTKARERAETGDCHNPRSGTAASAGIPPSTLPHPAGVSLDAICGRCDNTLPWCPQCDSDALARIGGP